MAFLPFADFSFFPFDFFELASTSSLAAALASVLLSDSDLLLSVAFEPLSCSLDSSDCSSLAEASLEALASGLAAWVAAD